MRTAILSLACLFLVLPCQAKTITVEAPQPVSVTIEADDFDAGTDISMAFDDITLSFNGSGPVYAVTSTNANGNLGTNSIGPSSDTDVWSYSGQTCRVDFNGLAKQVSVRLIKKYGVYQAYAYLKAFNAAGTMIQQTSRMLGDSIYYTFNIEREYFDIAYVTTSCGDPICLDHFCINFLPVYHGPTDFTKIQDAIDSASNGDVIEVWLGTYYEHINFYGKAVTVTSSDPNDAGVVNATIINATGSGKAVTFESLENETSVLTGFTITDGDEGIYCYYSNPLISDCVIKNNVTGIYGDVAFPAILNTAIQSNSGVGIFDCDGSISDCTISGNSDAGVAYCDGNVQNCRISGNDDVGLSGCQGQITNCVINNNLNNGVANCNADITNCTIVGNKGHGVTVATQCLTNNIIVKNWNYGVNNVGSDVLAYNNIWGNLDGSYSNVIPCPTDIHKDPRFAIDGYWDADDNWVEGEYHLKSAAGRWTESGWIYDDVNSSCIDAGDPNDSVGSEPNPNGGRINMGAYGGTVEASKSPSGIIEPICSEYPAMDFNKDCKVDFKDFALFTQTWLDCNLDPQEACWE